MRYVLIATAVLLCLTGCSKPVAQPTEAPAAGDVMSTASNSTPTTDEQLALWWLLYQKTMYRSIYEADQRDGLNTASYRKWSEDYEAKLQAKIAAVCKAHGLGNCVIEIGSEDGKMTITPNPFTQYMPKVQP